MYGLDRETAAKRSAELLDFMQLADQPKKMVTDYSHGMQKKLAMAAAVYRPMPGRSRSPATVSGIFPSCFFLIVLAAACNMRARR